MPRVPLFFFLAVLAFQAFAVTFKGVKFAFEQEYKYPVYMISEKEKKLVAGDDGLNVCETVAGSGILVSMDDPRNKAPLPQSIIAALPAKYTPFNAEPNLKGLLELKTLGVKDMTPDNLLAQLTSLMAFRSSITTACSAQPPQTFRFYPFEKKYARYGPDSESQREDDGEAMVMEHNCGDMRATIGNEIQITVDLPWAALMTSPLNPYAQRVVESFKVSVGAWTAVQEFTNFADFVKNDDICRQEARALLGYLGHYLGGCGKMKNTWGALPKLDLQKVYLKWQTKCGGVGQDIFQALVAHLRSTKSGKVQPKEFNMEVRVAIDRGDYKPRYVPNTNWNVPPRGDAQGWLFPFHPKVADCLDALEYCTVKYADLEERFAELDTKSNQLRVSLQQFKATLPKTLTPELQGRLETLLWALASNDRERDSVRNCKYNSHAGDFAMKDVDGYLYSAVEIRKAQEMTNSKFIEVANRANSITALDGVEKTFFTSDCEGFSTEEPTSVAIALQPKPIGTKPSIGTKPYYSNPKIETPSLRPPLTRQARMSPGSEPENSSPPLRPPLTRQTRMQLSPGSGSNPPLDCIRSGSFGLEDADDKCKKNPGGTLPVSLRQWVCNGEFACLKPK